MKKKIVLLLAGLSVSQMLYAHTCGGGGCPFCTGEAYKVVKEGDVEESNVKYDHIKLNTEYETNVYKIGFGRKDFDPFLYNPSEGSFKINLEGKINEHHKFDAAFKSKLNLIPHQYDRKAQLEENIENLKQIKSELEKDRVKNKNTISRVENKIKELEEEVATFTDDNKVRWAYQPLAKFESAHVGYEYNHDDKAKVYVKLGLNEKVFKTMHTMQTLSLSIKPTYEVKEYLPVSDSIKVNSLLLNTAYEINSQSIGENTEFNQFVDLGFKTKIKFPHEFKFEADLSKLVSFRFNHDPADQNQANKTFVNGEAKFKLSKNFELFKDDKNELNLSNETSWYAKWAWNEMGKTVVDKDGEKHKYGEKFIKDEFVNETKLAYDYKINDSLKLASELALKYEATYDRDRTIFKPHNKVEEVKNAMRVHTFKPTAQVGLHYDKKLNDKVKVYSNLDFEFSTAKEENQERAYLIEPKFKLGFKYIY